MSDGITICLPLCRISHTSMKEIFLSWFFNCSNMTFLDNRMPPEQGRPANPAKGFRGGPNACWILRKPVHSTYEIQILTIKISSFSEFFTYMINITADRKCGFDMIPDSHPHYLDVVISGVANEAECQRRCNTNMEFICQSYAFYAAASQCFISGDDKGRVSTLTVKMIFS